MNKSDKGSGPGPERLECQKPQFQDPFASSPSSNAKEAPNGGVDAGLKSLDHYKRALPKWRYNLRQSTLPLVRWETPYLAYLQSAMRTPALDSYFAITANLGTHTFFMIGLPVLFWCGFTGFGRGLVRILAAGVFSTGFLKDMCSLPRPLSPPLHRITMSGSAALEYGFPSTHSANAVSVAVYGILMMRSASDTFPPTVNLTLELLAYFYALSIVFGRLYCGMHGFLDVIVGSVMGAAISLVEFYYGPSLDQWVQAGSFLAPFTVLLVLIVLVRVHPEPADDCPCFDDSVAFAGVVIGLELGTWRFAQSGWSALYNGPSPAFSLAALGWPVATARLVAGVLSIFLWREAAKPTLLRLLPHLFRYFETHGLSLPRRFFMRASEYTAVPLRLRDDNVMPSVSDIPKMVRSIRGPGRGRSVSIGPQSAADAYETLAYRERRRRESMDSLRSASSMTGLRERADEDGTAVSGSGGGGGGGEERDNAQSSAAVGAATSSGAHFSIGSRLAEFEHAMGQGTVVVMPRTSTPVNNTESSGVGNERGDNHEQLPNIYVSEKDELGEKEVFSRLVKPRVRYDVEVVTKLVVYTGIAWLATDLTLAMFEFIGLGAGHLLRAS